MDGILPLLGLSLLGGALGAWIFQRLHIPQVVGYIVIGLILGQVGFGFIQASDIQNLLPLNLFALGIIGFLVGGELKFEIFRKYGRQFSAILLGEGVTAFVFVGVGTFALMYIVLSHIASVQHPFPSALATGIVFGAIASATDPASTIDVLWEYRSRGVLTTSVTAIVALDDALAMTLYGLGTGIAQLLVSGNANFGHEIWGIIVEVFGALLAGAVFALVLWFLIHWIRQSEKMLAISIGLILLLIAVAVKTGMDVILSTMMLGFSLVNLAPRKSAGIFKVMRGFSTPIYVLFFVLVGARLTVGNLPLWLWGIIGIYLLGRSVGKMAGAWFGAKISGSAPVVRKYLGLALFAQGGVAIGLSIMASQHLAGIHIAGNLSLGDAVIFAVTATTLVVQIGGPPMVKLAIQRAGEAGRNITDEDIIEELTVGDTMDKDIEPLHEETHLSDAVKIFSEINYSVVPVTDKNNRLIGTVSLQGMRNVLADQDAWEWLLVSDILEPLHDKTTPDTPLRNALRHMNRVHIQQMPVVAGEDSDESVGVLDLTRAQKRVSAEVLRRQSIKGVSEDDADAIMTDADGEANTGDENDEDDET